MNNGGRYSSLCTRRTGITQHINECPNDKWLNRYVISKVCAAGPNKWRDLGIELMEQDDVHVLDVIKSNNTADNVECCSKLFTEWRERTPGKASWKQLIEALKEVKLTTLASELEELLLPSVEQPESCGGVSKMSLARRQQQLEEHKRPLQELEDHLSPKLIKCKDNLKHYYDKRLNQKLSTRWPELGDSNYYLDVTITRAMYLYQRKEKDISLRMEKYCEQYAMGLIDNQADVTIEKLLVDGEGQVVLIEGDPGSGKTSLTLQICKLWVKGELLTKEFLIHIPLHSYELATNVNNIFELVEKLGCPLDGMKEYFEQNNGEGLVLIMDGWDELPNELQEESLFNAIAFNKDNTFFRSTIIITSRPSCSEAIAKVVEKRGAYYQILGFSPKNSELYIKHYFHDDMQLANSLLACLESRENLRRHFNIPITLAIMCFVYFHSDGHIPETLSKLYMDFAIMCIDVNACCRGIEKFSDIPENLRCTFGKLCKTAFDMLEDKKLVFDENQLGITEIDLKNCNIDSKHFDGFGLLRVEYYSTKRAIIKRSYSFIHRAVQELLAAVHIVLFDNIIDVVDKHFYKGSYLMNMFPFLFGLVSQEHLKTVVGRNKEPLKLVVGKLKEIFIKSDRNNELFSSILYCLFEAHDKTFCHEFGQVFSKRDIYLAFNTILELHYFCYFISTCDSEKLNVTIHYSFSFKISADQYIETVAKYLHNASTRDIASFECYLKGGLSHKGMKQFAKVLDIQRNILSIVLHGVECDPGCITILCDMICKCNSQITKLVLPDAKLNKNDLQSIRSLLITCLSLESLDMMCSPSEGVYLHLLPSFCEALCKTKTLQKLGLFNWTLSQANCKVFGNIISQNCSLKELCIMVDTADCLDSILQGLSSNTSMMSFSALPDVIGTSNTLGQCLKECLTHNHSLKTIVFSNSVKVLLSKNTHIFLPFKYILWSSEQVNSICTVLCTNDSVVTIDISGCHIDTEACDAVCNMLSKNTTLQYLFLNPVYLEKREAIDIIKSCKTNATLKLLSLVQWPPNTWFNGQGKHPFEFRIDKEIKHILQQIQKVQQEKDGLLLDVCWKWNERTGQIQV